MVWKKSGNKIMKNDYVKQRIQSWQTNCLQIILKFSCGWRCFSITLLVREIIKPHAQVKKPRTKDPDSLASFFYSLLVSSLKGLFIKTWQHTKSRPLETRLRNVVQRACRSTLYPALNGSPVSVQSVWSSSNTQYCSHPPPFPLEFLWISSGLNAFKMLGNAEWTLEWELPKSEAKSNSRDRI